MRTAGSYEGFQGLRIPHLPLRGTSPGGATTYLPDRGEGEFEIGRSDNSKSKSGDPKMDWLSAKGRVVQFKISTFGFCDLQLVHYQIPPHLLSGKSVVTSWRERATSRLSLCRPELILFRP